MRANIGGIFYLFFCCCLALGLGPGGEASGAEATQRVRIAYASRSSLWLTPKVFSKPKVWMWS